MSDIPSKLEEVQALIAKIDIAVRQVLIESRIVIADDTFGRSLGVRLGAADLRGVRGGLPGYSVGGDTRVSVGGNLNAVGSQTLQNGTTGVTFSDTNFLNLPATGQNGFDPATFALSLFGASANRFLNLEISALEADGKGKVVSSPRVVTADQQKALIEQGEELPYQVATSSGATSLQFRKANLKLEVTPQVTPEGNVILDVDITKDSVGRATTAGFAINTKHVKTQVLVENGGTVVIGGIFEQNDREDITKVPFLGDVPYLGNLFKTRNTTSSKTELLDFPDAQDRHRPHCGALSARPTKKASEPSHEQVAEDLDPRRAVICVASCGGGGGSAGTSPFGSGGRPPLPGCLSARFRRPTSCATAANLTLLLDTASIQNTGASTVKATATATTASGQALTGIPSPSRSTTARPSPSRLRTRRRPTDQSVATVSIGADPSNRLITVTATSGSLSVTKTFRGHRLGAHRHRVPAIVAPEQRRQPGHLSG